MDTKALKKTYYSLLANDPDYPAWEEFEIESIEFAHNKWLRFTAPIPHTEWDCYRIRHNPKPKPWSPAGGIHVIDLGNDETNHIDEQYEDNAKCFIKNGLTRTNKEQAEQDLKLIRQFCRFLAWRAENCCHSDEIVPVTNYAGCFLNDDDYFKLVKLVNSGEVEL